ncbi:MAG: DUF4276 family protein [Nostocaceae cyanobacterium]|nr:DUF4276 family protein [Nostocaceae cyanobacterium]
MSLDENDSNQPCYFFEFGLMVTGETEAEHLPKLFKSLTKSGICTFKVVRRINQRSPRTSSKRKLKVTGTEKIIPQKDVDEIGIPARQYLSKNPCGYLLLVDDLEKDRTNQAQQVFARYRLALDTILGKQKERASVHFLVNMIEAYYFADSNAINSVLGTSETDYSGDVETIPHPKNDLKKIYPGFDEKEDGGKILDHLNVEHVLSRSDTCASLRTIFAWCSKVLSKYPDSDSLEETQTNQYLLENEKLSEITKQQLDNI